jgi:hypothetical protein
MVHIPMGKKKETVQQHKEKHQSTLQDNKDLYF